MSLLEADDERLFGQLIVQNAVLMQDVRFGSTEWERLDAVHSALMDVTKQILQMRGKLIREGRHDACGC